MATINDVAELAGVSVKTVSRYLSGFEGISAKTVARIEKATTELEYFPSAAARSLRGQTTGIVSLIADNLTTSPFAADIVKGVHAVCEKNDKLLLIGETGENQKTFEKLVDRFRQQKTEAIITAASHHKTIHITQSFEQCPLVLVNCFDDQRKYPSIVPDDRQGSYDLTRRLLALGHKNIAFVMLPEDMVATRLRRQGFEEAMHEAGAEINPKWMIYSTVRRPPDTLQWLRSVLETMLAPRKRPTAILCGNDKMAFRMLMQLHAMGLEVPKDVSVVGYDDFRLISESTVPGLTTAALPYYQMGVRAAELALSLTTSKARPRAIEAIHCDLIVRDSDRALRRRKTTRESTKASPR
ncbi:MAG: LacI family transcriptional regulator [Gammaproteobacteria bacterium]|nr:LacI family transcriptional regulator [Gammaproteobacteria bacterium]